MASVFCVSEAAAEVLRSEAGHVTAGPDTGRLTADRFYASCFSFKLSQIGIMGLYSRPRHSCIILFPGEM